MSPTVRRLVAYLACLAPCLCTAGEAHLRGDTPIVSLSLTKLSFSQQQISASASEIKVGLGSSQTVSLAGAGVPGAQVVVADPSVATATLTGSALTIHGLNSGGTIVTVRNGAAAASIGVEVRPWAAAFPQTLQVDVSGSPALASTVEGAIDGALRTRVVTVPNGSCTFRMPPVPSIPAGATKTLTVNAGVTAQDTLPASGDVTVVVHNLGLRPVADSALWYSNDPESVERPGALFSSSLKLGQAVRLLYHHLNASEQAMYFRVQAINDSDQTAELLVVPGDSGPDRNPVHAGLLAAEQYLRRWQFESGEVVSIPPHSTIPVSLRRLLVGEVTSGLCGLRLVSGPKEMQIRTDAWPLFPIDKRWENALWTPTPWRQVGCNPINDYDTAPYEASEHVFPDPYRDVSFGYEVGGRFGEFRIGQRPIASQDEEDRLDGNFGVLYRIKATISNPTNAPADVELTFEASAGYAAGLFLVNGDVATTPLLSPKGQACIGRFHLAPGAKQTLSITTLPLSGGSYPATLTLRPVPQGSKNGT